MPIDLALQPRFNPELNKGWFGATNQIINFAVLSIIVIGAA